jgi:hypothetical protein
MRRNGIFVSLLAGFSVGVVCACLVTPGPARGQAPVKKPSATRASKTTWKPPRTKWGDPDLEGVWQGFETVPLERPLAVGDKKFYTDAEIADKVAKAEAKAKERKALIAAGKVEHQGFRGVPNTNAIFEYSDSDATPHISKWTSAIVDSPDGRLPPWTLEQVKYWESREAATKGHGETDTPDDMNLNTRCINTVSEAEVTNWGMAFGGAPATHAGFSDKLGEDVDLGDGYGTNASPGPVRRILQSPGYVAFVMGDKPEYRIVPLDGHPHPSANIREWLGDARGHWEGNTLIVDITNITFGSPVIPNYGGALYPGSGETLHVIERFTRIDANTLQYEYTIDDPAVYVRPYTVRHLLRKNDSYAGVTTICQEDPKDLANSLANARADEENSLQNGEDSVDERRPRFEQLKQQAIAAANRQNSNPGSTSTK